MEKFEIVISSKAQSDFANCIEFLLSVSKEAAIDLSNNILDALESLNLFPERNPIFDMPKSCPYIVRKMIIKGRYIALYSIIENKVVVFRILDSRKKFEYLIP